MDKSSKKEQLTSKERVLTAFASREADRVPVNYISNPGLERRLQDHYGLMPGDHEGLLRKLGVDFRGIGVPYKGKKLFVDDIPGVRVDPVWGKRTRWVEHESGGYWDYCNFRLKDAGEADTAAWPMPSPGDFDYSTVAETCRRYRDYAVYYGGPGIGDIINSSGMLFGTERVYMGLALEDEALLNYIDRKLEVQIEVLHRVLEAARGGVDFLWMGEDLGTQRGPIISPDLYRRMLKPRQKRIIDAAKRYRLPVMIHCCGSCSWAFEDFIEIGINVVDTLQPEAANMSPEYLKKKYGGRLAFHGCISTAGPVACGTVAEVRECMVKTLDIMMPGGGYCMAPTHQLQDNSPTENVVEMYEAVHQYGWY